MFECFSLVWFLNVVCHVCTISSIEVSDLLAFFNCCHTRSSIDIAVFFVCLARSASWTKCQRWIRCGQVGQPSASVQERRQGVQIAQHLGQGGQGVVLSIMQTRANSPMWHQVGYWFVVGSRKMECMTQNGALFSGLRNGKMSKMGVQNAPRWIQRKVQNAQRKGGLRGLERAAANIGNGTKSQCRVTGRKYLPLCY